MRQEYDWVDRTIFLMFAYAYECKTRAFATLGDSEKMNDYFVKAKDFGEQIGSEKDRKYSSVIYILNLGMNV